jgi:predicted Zn-dependent protease
MPVASRLFRLGLVACLAASQVVATAAQAQNLPLIRDSEIEDTIRTWADPLFAAAGLNPESVRILLVNNETVNAFVAGGQNLFINTGLLIASESPGQVIGVIAHETGHIAGGHLARVGDAMRTAQNLGLFATLLGIGMIAAGAATGGQAGRAGGAVIAGGQSAGQRTFLAYTRAQENAADQAALTFLDRTHHSAAGLEAFLEKLMDQELLISDRQNPYVRTHPLAHDRIELIAQHVRNSRWSSVPDSDEDVMRHKRMKAKLIGFLERPQRVLKTYYPESDVSVPARYARAVAYFRRPDMEKALAEVDSLIAESPDDPYFLELKGQILFESGKPREAVPYYQAAADIRPEDALILTGLGQAQVESGDAALLSAAVDNLEAARRRDPDNPSTWRLLATAYHQLGDVGASSLAAGEHALLIGHAEVAIVHADRAERESARGSPAWLRAQDIRNEAEQLKTIQARGER